MKCFEVAEKKKKGRKACVNLSPPGYGIKIKRMHVFIPEHKAGALK